MSSDPDDLTARLRASNGFHATVASDGMPGVRVDMPLMREAADAIDLRNEALYVAWTIIANAYVNASPGPETGWDAAPAEWREAAERWRDEQFHPLVGGTTP